MTRTGARPRSAGVRVLWLQTLHCRHHGSLSTDPPCVCLCGRVRLCGCCGRVCSVAENRRERRERKGRNKPPRPKETRAERDARRAKRRAQKEEEERLRLEAERIAAEEFERKKAAEEAERRRLAEEAAAAAAAKARADAETKLVELKQQQEQRTKLRLLNSEVRPRPPQHVLSACLSWQHCAAARRGFRRRTRWLRRGLCWVAWSRVS